MGLIKMIKSILNFFVRFFFCIKKKLKIKVFKYNFEKKARKPENKKEIALLI